MRVNSGVESSVNAAVQQALLDNRAFALGIDSTGAAGQFRVIQLANPGASGWTLYVTKITGSASQNELLLLSSTIGPATFLDGKGRNLSTFAQDAVGEIRHQDQGTNAGNDFFKVRVLTNTEVVLFADSVLRVAQGADVNVIAQSSGGSMTAHFEWYEVQN